MELSSKKCFITRDISFVETVFLFQQLSPTQTDLITTTTYIFYNSPFHVPPDDVS